MFKRFNRDHPDLHALGIGLAIVFFWRGAWGLMDLYFFPDNPAISYFISLILGVALLLLIDLRLRNIE